MDLTRRKSISSSNTRGGALSSLSDDLIIFQYKFIKGGKDIIEFNGSKISNPVTNKVDKTKTNIAILFNKALFTLCEKDYTMTDSASRATFAVRTHFNIV